MKNKQITTIRRHGEKNKNNMLSVIGAQRAYEEGWLWMPKREIVMLYDSGSPRAHETNLSFYKGLRAQESGLVVGVPASTPELTIPSHIFTPEIKKIYKGIIKKEGFGAAIQWCHNHFAPAFDKHSENLVQRLTMQRDPRIEEVMIGHSGPLEIFQAYITGEQPNKIPQFDFLEGLQVVSTGGRIVDVERVPAEVYSRTRREVLREMYK